MTTLIRGSDKIAGLAAIDIRRFFRHVASHHQDAFEKQWLMDYLRLNDSKASQVISRLVREGYVLRETKDLPAMFKFTELGSALVRASAAKRIARFTAEKALEAFMSRVREVNGSPKYLYTVSVVAVFGSYLNWNTQRLGDVDVAVRLDSRILDCEVRLDKELKHARNSGRSFSRFFDQLTWAHDEVMLALKAKKRSISIQAWDSFLHLVKNPEFQFQLLLGTPGMIQSGPMC